ncbi:FAD-binding oxidoreductase [Streptomyces sp. NPDC001480]|uniref:FAD-binding oxidoreductase n=1 Tax=Streptomyces sp. NPDC001480 TaxID=3364577 RepID=UPI0036974B66
MTPARSPPGQYLSLRLTVGEAAPAVRSYSLSSTPTASTYRISVKHEPRGKVSSYLMCLPPPRSCLRDGLADPVRNRPARRGNGQLPGFPASAVLRCGAAGPGVSCRHEGANTRGVTVA